MTTVSVAQALEGRIPVGGEVTIRGWVRTRRDSKAGLSFVNVSDGSCFAPIQVVAPQALPNYADEVQRLSSGCSVIARGTLAESQGKGQSFEIQAESIEVVGWVEDPAPAPAPTTTSAPAPAAPAPAPAAPSAPSATAAAPAAVRARRTAPSFARARRDAAAHGPPGRRWALPAAIAGLALLLGLQWLLADRDRLAADPGWRPLVSGVCGVLRCSLPAWHEPAAFTLLERDVRPHPEVANVLRITASFRNDAAWPQDWPEVVLTLSDLDGRPLGVRAFAASEYLGGAPATPRVGSGEGAIIRMDVVEPGPGAVGFSFDFR